MLRLVEGRRRLPRLPRERRLQHRDDPDARDGRGRGDRAPDHVPRARGPQRPARRALLGCRRWPAAGRCSTWRRTAPRRRATSSARTLPVRDVFAWGATLVHGDRTDRRGQRGDARPLRGRPRRDDGRVVVVEGRPREPLRGVRRRRPDRPGHHLDRRCGRSSSGRRATSARRPMPTRAGSSRSPTRPTSTGTTR